MKKKQTILTVILLFFSILINAQDKYEFMIIEFDPLMKNEIIIAIDGKELIEEKADFTPTEKSRTNTTPLLKKVREYQDKGWELMNFDVIAQPNIVYFAYLRKKKLENK